jgi:uncharacterized membrane protein (DUF485 family)
MPAFDHAPTAPEPHDEVVARRNARYGLLLFAIYLVNYGAFVALNAFSPAVMAEEAFAGLNLAVAYGLELIVAALVLAAVYGWLCRKPKEPM